MLLRDVNSTGTLASETNGRGFTTSYEYDDLNRLTGIDYPIHADVSIDYGAQGGASRRTLSRSQYRQTELIDDFGQTIRTERTDVQSGQTIYRTMDFDAMGRQTFLSYPNSGIGLTTSFDSLGRITRTEHPDSTAVTYTHNDARVVVLNERNSCSEYLYLIHGLDDSPKEPYYILQNSTVATRIDRDPFGGAVTAFDNSGGVAPAPWPMQRHDSAGSSSQCFNSVSFSFVSDTDGDQIEDCDELWLGQDPNDPSDGAPDLNADEMSARAADEQPARFASGSHWPTRSLNPLWHVMWRWQAMLQAGRQS